MPLPFNKLYSFISQKRDLFLKDGLPILKTYSTDDKGESGVVLQLIDRGSYTYAFPVPPQNTEEEAVVFMNK
jgi:hypothetical protein